MIYILLDIDGVLNTVRNTIDESKVGLLGKMLKAIETEYKESVFLILSSNWRCSEQNIHYINQRLCTIHRRLHGTIPMDSTGIADLTQRRIHCIQQWANTLTAGERWLALDDLHCEELGDQHFKWINPDTGLVVDDIPAVVQQIGLP